jgi:hypothetical protein
MADLRTRYLGLELRSPLVASSSPLTGSLDGLRRLEAAGAGAVVLPSLFEEELAEETGEVDALLATGATSAEARAGHPAQAGYGAGPAAYLSLVERAKQALSVPVIASLNGVSRTGGSATPAGWRRPAPTPWSSTSTTCRRGRACRAARSSGTTWTRSGRCAGPSGSRWRSS